MKLPRKLIALALAGVMALTLLTGCGGNSKAKTVAEDLADIQNDILISDGINDTPIKFSYNVLELSQIKAQLTPEWFGAKNYVILSNTVTGSTTVQTLVETALAKYSDTSKYAVMFNAIKLPKGASAFVAASSLMISDLTDTDYDNYIHYLFGLDTDDDAFDAFYGSAISSGKIGVDYKTINGDTYCLAVVILEK